MMLDASGNTLIAAHKMTGQISVIDTAARRVIANLTTDPETNHPNFAVINGTTHVFVTVASMNHTKVYSQASPGEIPVYLTSIPASGVEPHGIWPSPDNSRVYVLNERKFPAFDRIT